ncbi:response regulator [Cohnella thailandensis]|uniref:Response regulator n=1 Tax=Cohnella thailandensis TaxID=557557 RepID=A0A841SRU0_9BACL|nr:response regulator [Cohnella thailandensis]MBB6634654.1 response regulator [Cohnella thailandensis]MBP1972790.1 two-component system response regulator YesN [Cohnella thailandensis]
MYQVLLVDDEPLVRHHLSRLLNWEKHGFELRGEAFNGSMAMEMIERSEPHVAILDVNMPGMNGVELNRSIRGRFPSVRTIMLSSYDDYDYVRECLKDGATDYLLKHRLDESALLSTLNKAVADRGLGTLATGEKSAESAVEDPSRPTAVLRDYLADLARGKPGAAEKLEAYAKESGLFPGAKGFVAAAVQIISFRLLTEGRSDVETSRLSRQAVDIMQQSLGDVRERTAAYAEDGRLIVLFAFKERSEHLIAGEVSRAASKLQYALELFLNQKCMVAAGHVCGSLSQLGASYGTATRALDLTPSSAQPQGLFDARVSLTIEEQKELLLSIELLDVEGMNRLLASVFSSVRGQPVHSQTVQMIVSELLHIGDKAVKKWMPALSSEGAGELPSRGGLGKIADIGELERWLQAYYASLLELLKRRRANGPYSRHVSQAIELILEKYPGYITLEMAAGAIGLHPSYLSRIFKEETRSTFSEYLNRVRIDVSCKLLESGRYTIKQISTQAGFANYNYFFKVFKEVKGMTPQAYLNGDRSVKKVE